MQVGYNESYNAHILSILCSQQFGTDSRQTDRQYSKNGDYSYVGLAQARPQKTCIVVIFVSVKPWHIIIALLCIQLERERGRGEREVGR